MPNLAGTDSICPCTWLLNSSPNSSYSSKLRRLFTKLILEHTKTSQQKKLIPTFSQHSFNIFPPFSQHVPAMLFRNSCGRCIPPLATAPPPLRRLLRWRLACPGLSAQLPGSADRWKWSTPRCRCSLDEFWWTFMVLQCHMLMDNYEFMVLQLFLWKLMALQWFLDEFMA